MKANEETDIITFYNKLFSLIRSIHKHNILIIGEDKNAQIGEDKNNKLRILLDSRKERENYWPAPIQITRKFSYII